MRRKLTLTIDENVLRKAKEKASLQGVSISKIVEKALKYFVNPQVYCFNCGYKFEAKESEVCHKCGWYKCPKCGVCACNLGEEGVKVAFYMRKALQDVFSSPDV